MNEPKYKINSSYILYLTKIIPNQIDFVFKASASILSHMPNLQPLHDLEQLYNQIWT